MGGGGARIKEGLQPGGGMGSGLGQGLSQLLPPPEPCAPSRLTFPFCKQTSRWGNRDSKKVKAGI